MRIARGATLMNMRNRRRPTRPSLLPLEPRCLLSGNTPTATWLGQDGRDFVGYSPNPGGNGVQDIHIGLSGLAEGRSIVSADVQGLGGGEWTSRGGPNSWLADVVRAPGSSGADLYIEPYQADQGRPYNIHLNYDDGTSDSLWVNGGPVDPNLRMAHAAVQVAWVGQDGRDLVGDGPAVGPDNVQDVHLAVSNLSAGVPVLAAKLTGPGGLAWEVGLNPGGNSNAELVRASDASTTADLYINPSVNLSGQTLTLTLTYPNNKTDTAAVVAGKNDPGLRMPPPAPVAIRTAGVSATWAGQDNTSPAGRGNTHVVVGGIPAGRTVVAAAVSDQSGLAWSYKANDSVPFAADLNAGPLAVLRSADATRADLYFPPARNEAGATLTARLLLDDGTTLVTRFAGGASDPGLLSPDIAPTSVVARPGDDLNALANAYGTVRLSSGTYSLSSPLVLNQAVTITADPGATLVFSQGANDPAWTAAIKVHAGHTTLENFAVRFATPIRWASGINYGPAVIGTTDNLDPAGAQDPKAAIAIKGMDLQSPPPASSWEEAPRLLRLVSAASGEISGNILKGGMTEVVGGPWTIVNNASRGTVPGTYSFGVFGTHQTHDLVLSGNTAADIGPSGKTWRFLVMTGSGVNDVVANNNVSDVGPRDADTVPSNNAPETILTEAYRLHFEGKPAAISADGLVLQIPTPQGDAARTGDVVAILGGPAAGRYRVIAQALDAKTYLLDSPLPAGDYPISIATGFVGETFRGNTVDDRGSTLANPLVLAGNHFGTKVLGNTLMGGDRALTVAATPTEQPVFYGWSHDPMFGLVIADNVLADAVKGGVLDVNHDASTKSNRGRVYLTASLTNNVVKWSSAFLGQQARVGGPGLPTAFVLGQAGGIDAGEMVLDQSGNRMDVPDGTQPGATVKVIAATINGQALADRGITLPVGPPPAPPGLALVNDTGASPSDRVTSDGRVIFAAEPGAVGYESRVGTAGAYVPATPGVPFLPAGLASGVNVVSVRAFDASGRRGPDAMLTIAVAPDTPPVVVAPVAVPATPPSPVEVIANIPLPIQAAFGNPPPPAARPPASAVTSPTTTGGAGTVHVAEVASPSGVWLGQDGTDLTGRWSIMAGDGMQDVHIRLSNLPSARTVVYGELKGAGGNVWRLGGAPGIYAFALVRTPGSNTADLYFSPYKSETGRTFSLTLKYDNGTSSLISIQGGTSILGLAMPTATVTAASFQGKPITPAQVRVAALAQARAARAYTKLGVPKPAGQLHAPPARPVKAAAPKPPAHPVKVVHPTAQPRPARRLRPR